MGNSPLSLITYKYDAFANPGHKHNIISISFSAKPDKYGTSMLVAFLQQLLTYRGFYDHSNLEWVGLEKVQVVGSITAGTGMGRHMLNTR